MAQEKEFVGIIANKQSGSVDTVAQLRAVIDEQRALYPNKKTELRILEQEGDVERFIAEFQAKGLTTLIAAGGDGTVRSVLTQTIGTGLKTAVIPMGTFNHFARQIGVPLDMTEALHVALQGKTQYVDVGKVNEYYFLNFSALGMYTNLITRRSALQKRGWPKWIAFIRAMYNVMFRFRSMTMEFVREDATMTRRSPFAFVGNNPLSVQGFDVLGAQSDLSDGLLQIGVVRNVGWLSVGWLYLRAFVGMLNTARDIDISNLRSFEVRMPNRKKVSVGVDGEIVQMETPLHYESVPQGLLVCVPEKTTKPRLVKRVHLIRHAESEGNAKRRYQKTDTKLSEQGRRQLDDLVQRFESVPIDVVLASTAVRARETAEALAKAKQVPIVFSADVLEVRRASTLHGRRYASWTSFKVWLSSIFHAHNSEWHYNDEENAAEILARTEQVIQLITSREERSVAVVSHAVFLQALVASIFTPKLPAAFIVTGLRGTRYLQNVSRTSLSLWDDDGAMRWQLDVLNKT